MVPNANGNGYLLLLVLADARTAYIFIYACDIQKYSYIHIGYFNPILIFLIGYIF